MKRLLTAVIVAAALVPVLGFGARADASTTKHRLPTELANISSPAISYRLGRSHDCAPGWLKRTERHRVKRKMRRFIVCAILDSASVTLSPPPYSPSPYPTFTGGMGGTWSGYVEASAGPYTSVSAQWIEPQINSAASPPNSSVAIWTGIDGNGISPLFQSGTESNCANGGASDFAWFTDDIDGYAPQAKFPVYPGDTIFTRDWQVSPGLWQYVIADLTQGNIATSWGVPWSGAYASAEWIVEDPGYLPPATLPAPLANFGSVTFQDLGVSVAGQPGPLPVWSQARDLQMMHNTVADSTSPVTGAGSSAGFTVYDGTPVP